MAKENKQSIYPPPALWKWFRKHAAAQGLTVNGIIITLMLEYKERNSKKRKEEAA